MLGTKRVKIISDGLNSTNKNMLRIEKKLKLKIRDQIQLTKIYWRQKMTFTLKITIINHNKEFLFCKNINATIHEI